MQKIVVPKKGGCSAKTSLCAKANPPRYFFDACIQTIAALLIVRTISKILDANCCSGENAVDIPIQSKKDIAYYRNTEIQKYRSTKTYVVDFPLRSRSLEWTLRIDYSGVDSLVHPHIYF